MKEKLCGVCRDRAVGNNFGALSCESCRSFFRRNVSKMEELKCFFGNQCLIDYNTRKFCKKCRLEKCLAVGMKKDLTQNNSNNRIVRRRPVTVESDEWTCNASVSSNSLETCNMRPNIAAIPMLIRGLITGLSDDEMTKYRGLFRAASHLRDPIANITRQTNDFGTALSLIQKRCDVKVRRIIKMTTDLSEFSSLSEDDKILLIKFGCREIITLLTIANFDYEDETWLVSIDNENATKIALDYFLSVSQTLYHGHRNFLLSFKEQWNHDSNILDLLCGIILFNANRKNLFDIRIIESEQRVYKHLLQRYLELKYQSKSEAEYRYQRLMTQLQELYALKNLYDELYCTNPDTLRGSGPLVMEIYQDTT